MDNLPAGIYSWELDIPEHSNKCLDQEDGADCICDQVEESDDVDPFDLVRMKEESENE